MNLSAATYCSEYPLDFRDREKKEYDAADFRRIARTNYESVNRDQLRHLGDLVWEHGGEELTQFLDIAPKDESFPI